jgi:hypothetical protein
MWTSISSPWPVPGVEVTLAVTGIRLVSVKCLLEFASSPHTLNKFSLVVRFTVLPNNPAGAQIPNLQICSGLRNCGITCWTPKG